MFDGCGCGGGNMQEVGVGGGEANNVLSSAFSTGS